MRLIDADALIDTLYDHEFASYIDKGEVSTVINDEPTVDAVPVIRCKDCKWYSANTGYHWGRCENYRPFPFDETDYCSRAERKEE